MKNKFFFLNSVLTGNLKNNYDWIVKNQINLEFWQWNPALEPNEMHPNRFIHTFQKGFTFYNDFPSIISSVLSDSLIFDVYWLTEGHILISLMSWFPVISKHQCLCLLFINVFERILSCNTKQWLDCSECMPWLDLFKLLSLNYGKFSEEWIIFVLKTQHYFEKYFWSWGGNYSSCAGQTVHSLFRKNIFVCYSTTLTFVQSRV